MRKLSLATHAAFRGRFTHPALTHWGRHQPPGGPGDDTPGRPGQCPYKADAVLGAGCFSGLRFGRAMRQPPGPGKGGEQPAPDSLEPQSGSPTSFSVGLNVRNLTPGGP